MALMLESHRPPRGFTFLISFGPSVAVRLLAGLVNGGADHDGDAVAVADELRDDATAGRDDEGLRDARATVNLHQRLRYVAARPAQLVVDVQLLGEVAHALGVGLRAFGREADELHA